MNPIIECANVKRSFVWGVPVLDGVDFTINAGTVTGLAGRNGTGKSTLIKSILGLIRPQEGSIRVFGLDPFKEPVAVRSRIGYVAEKLVFPGYAKVEDILSVHRGLYPNWDNTFENQLVERFAINRRARFSSLSKGQAQQASLICAIAHRPALLLLDEPASGLDPAARRAFIEVYIELIANGPVTILLSSHDMVDVERICTDLAILHKGKILVKDEITALREGRSQTQLPAAPSLSDLFIELTGGAI